MREIIEQLGFKLIGQCMCGGSLNLNFGANPKQKGIKITIYPNKNKFVIKRDNSILKTGKSEQLIKALEENGIIKKTTEEKAEISEQTISESEANN